MTYIHQIVSYFFHHGTDTDIRRRVHARLQVDDEATDEALHAVWNETRDAEMAPEKLHEALQAVENRLFEGPVHRQFVLRRLRVAALWLVPVVLLATSTWLFWHSERTMTQLAATEMLQQSTANGEHRQLTLPDSTHVWLNAGSVIIYPSSFGNRERKVYLSGEAFFRVHRDADHPFVVSTNHADMRVLGTSFNVVNYPEADRLTVTLETGWLNVSIGSMARDYLLTPDNQLVFIPSTRRVDVHSVTARHYSSWREGELFFNDARLADVLRQMERTYNIRCHIIDDRYAAQRVRMHLNKDEKLVNILNVIKELVPGLTYTIDGKDVYFK